MHVTDLTGNQFPAQLTTTNVLELNGNQSLSATILPTKVNKAFISDLTEMWTITDHDNVEHKIIYAKRQGKGDMLTVDIKATPLFFDIMDTLRTYDRYDEHMTAQLAFSRIFADTGFSFTLNGQFDAVQWEGFGDGETRLETFKRALERYKCEFRIVGNIVYLEHQIGNDTNHQYRHRLNASNIVQEVDANEMWTYAKGYGDYGDGGGGEDWQNAKLKREYTSPLAGIVDTKLRHAPPIRNGNITDKDTMDAQLKTLVDESLKISITADIHDLTRQNYPIAQSQLGDRVFVIDERIGLDEEVRIVNKSITRNWRGDVLDVTLTFGSEGLAKRHQSNLNTAMKNVTDWITGRKTIPYSIVDEAIKNATQALKNAQTELKFENGILAIDKQNPNKVVIFNSAGVGISSDGGNTFRTAMTGDGLVADVVYAGTLNADRVTIFGGSETEYLSIVGNEFETRGKYTRTWFNETKTHDVGIQLRYGRLRFHNYENRRNLYFSEQGITTYLGGSDSEDGGNFGSGTIEFFSYRHNSVIRGLTLYSNNGVVALESEQRNVVIAPRYSSYANGRKFSFDVKDVTYEGYITFGKAGIRFSEGRSSGEPIIHATNANGDLASGSFYGRSFFGDLRPRGSYAYVRAPRLRIIDHDSATTSNFGDLQLNEIMAHSIRLNAQLSNDNFYIGTSDGEVRITNNLLWQGSHADTTYRPIRARSFIEQSSRDYKTEIKAFNGNAMEEVEKLTVVNYRFKEDIKRGLDLPQIGFISEDNPSISTVDKKAIQTTKIVAYNTKAIQELNERITKLEELLA